MLNKNIPWQASILIILYVINTCFVTLEIFTLSEFTPQEMEIFLGYAHDNQNTDLQKFSDQQLQELAQIFLTIAKWILISVLALSLFLVWNMYTGKRWSIWASIILSCIGLINATLMLSVLSLCVSGGMLYLGRQCLKEPYFQKQ